MARTLSVIGDRWTLLVLRNAFLGTRRFEDFRSGLRISRPRLSDRPQKLVAASVLDRVAYQAQPPRHEYRLTEKGRDLYPVMMTMLRWGDRWMDDGGGRRCVIDTPTAVGISTPRFTAPNAASRSTRARPARDPRRVPPRRRAAAHPPNAPDGNHDVTRDTFDQLLDGMQPQAGDGCYGATLTEDWLQGRAAFVGPAGEGGLDIATNTLRSGKSVTWAEARIGQGEQVCSTFSGCFGGSRASAIRVPPPPMPARPGVEDSRRFPFLPGVTPAFTQHFDMRWAIGDMPMSGSAQSEMGVWVRFREPGDFGEAHIVALMDLLPPAVLQMQREMKPISTLTWHLDLLDTLDADDARDGGGWWYFHVHAQAAANGYSQQNATLFTPAGRALAMSQQSIAVFA